jgi:hypothetical protein
LTNNVGAGVTTGPANRVFGAPVAYVLADGSKHILQINEDGEVVEYYQLGRTSPFSTQNITLSQLALGTSPNAPVPKAPVTPATPHPTRIGPGALPVTPIDPSGTVFAAQGMLQSPRDREAFQFTATRTGRIAIGLASQPNVSLQLSVFDRRSRRLPTRGGTATADVVAGRTYYILVQGTTPRTKPRSMNSRFGFGAFGVNVRYLETAQTTSRTPAHGRTASATRQALPFHGRALTRFQARGSRDSG